MEHYFVRVGGTVVETDAGFETTGGTMIGPFDSLDAAMEAAPTQGEFTIEEV